MTKGSSSSSSNRLSALSVVVSSLALGVCLVAAADSVGGRQVGEERASPISYVVYAADSGPRMRRQVTELAPGQQSPPPQTPPSIFSFIRDVGPGIQSAKSFTSMFSSSSGQQPAASSGPNPAELMGQLSSLIKSTQERSSKAAGDLVQSGQQSGQQVAQQSAEAAQSAQGGIQSALKEIGAGLQRIASNNPSLIPDVKNLYSSVSSKLSSASSSVAQAASPSSSQIKPAKTADELVDNLAKVATQPTQA